MAEDAELADKVWPAMSRPPAPENPPQGGGDPWTAFGYLVAGVGVYGLIGWGLDRWLNVSFLAPVGIVLGAVLGLVLVYLRLGRPPVPPRVDDDDEQSHSSSGPGQESPGPPPDQRGDSA